MDSPTVFTKGAHKRHAKSAFYKYGHAQIINEKTHSAEWVLVIDIL